jgi:hypothetical protein
MMASFATRLRRAPIPAAMVLLAVLGGLFYMYYVSLCDHGTFSLASLLVTFPHQPPRVAGTAPPRRVVISMSTMPGNLGSLNDTLHSLMRLSPRRADAIYVNMPRVNRRTGEAYPEPPEWLLHGFERVVVNRIETDYGPITKLLGCLDKETDPDTLIVTVDDDKTYKPHFLAKLVTHATIDPAAAWSLCGWGFMPFFAPQNIIPAYVPYFARGSHGRGVQVLQGVCGAAYRRRFFDAAGIAQLQQPAPECFTADDMWISGYLNARGIPRVLMPGKPWAYFTEEPATAPWMLHNERKHALSSINMLYGKDDACMRAVQRTLGPWRST